VSRAEDEPGVVLLHRRLAHKNSKWYVYADHIRGANGFEVKDYLVAAPQRSRPDLITGVVVLPVLRGEILLLRMYRHAVRRWSWEAPRGFADPDEPPEIAARRELAEETGLDCPASGLIPLGVCAPETGTLAGRGLLFAAVDCSPAFERDRCEPGLGECRAFSPEQALAMADTAEIEDGFTLAALYRYARLKPGAAGQTAPPDEPRP
jgi:ADP-ribose pyrophosphatase